ncbi:MAG: RNA methyltransferase [Alphaproteobacteria bacterium]|nr:RNA methyltransferase [Alphaproteobacteria bacterium]
MRGYFGIGVQGISKAMNLGSVFRTAHAFGASFVFTIGAAYDRSEGVYADTSDATQNMPYYEWPDLKSLVLPADCALVGVELIDGAALLPSFRHPRAAAYVLGAERSSLSPELLELCDHTIKIPTRFSVNLAIAGAIVMYDRLLSTGRFAERPVSPGGSSELPPPHMHGPPVWQRKERRRRRSKA